MTKPLVTDELWQIIEPLLPAEPPTPKPKGGRRIDQGLRLGTHRWVVECTLSWLTMSPFACPL
ncbi:MAG: hypothetical protein A2X25_08485 [Chloroflexi bacterium GWB2_49_20]|nr:MAG: hypothetical protein A2X25_08485 [Chloroflexi bacterium GWB2_49_20]OGN79528.1 MAG: hypothetical protein A2X26_05540 [Chloroflexi bacterium GWC2_49_37]OGN84549.1 MAG: hypothetical protein A2X27_10990 [Chloroflexi bacterium GWD2_49_16]HBG74027.1 hypothetical protein [Anaerolineae bacterium]HCC78829.1 hypothetical protein [Anaerolineae bacterium]